jgi:hypothetical protein
MAITTIPLSHLERDLQKTLIECADSGQTLVVELPDHRLLAIQSFDPNDDDSLMDELLSSNAEFQALVLCQPYFFGLGKFGVARPEVLRRAC